MRVNRFLVIAYWSIVNIDAINLLTMYLDQYFTAARVIIPFKEAIANIQGH